MFQPERTALRSVRSATLQLAGSLEPGTFWLQGGHIRVCSHTQGTHADTDGPWPVTRKPRQCGMLQTPLWDAGLRPLQSLSPSVL